MFKKSIIQQLIFSAFACSQLAHAGDLANARGVVIESVPLASEKPVRNIEQNSAPVQKATKNIVVAENNVTGEAASKVIKVQNVKGDEVLIIDGDQLDFEIDRTLHAKGDAKLQRGDQSIAGDDINYDIQNDTLHVQGNAHITLGDGEISGPELKMRLTDNIGQMSNASVLLSKDGSTATNNIKLNSEQFSQALGNIQNQQIGGNSSSSLGLIDENNALGELGTRLPVPAKPIKGRGDAELVLFEGQDKKHLKNARYTTCAANVDDWYIKAKDLTLNDYSESGVAKNAYLEFKGVPLLYTPWMSFSYNNQRKSGLLAPSYGTTTSSGLELLVPYYWNISPNKDATIATRYLSKRGIQFQTELRYLEEDYSGIANIEYLPTDDESRDNRYFANLKHQHTFGNGWSGGINFEKVSDDQYFSDLSTRIITTSRVLLPQQLDVNYGNGTWHFNGLVQKYQTLDDNSFPYERLPQLTLTGNKYYGDLNVNLYSQLASFKSSNPYVLQADGVRTTLYPSISYEFTKPYGYVKPKLGIHYTNYQLNNVGQDLDSPSRTLPIFSVDSGLYFDRQMSFKGTDFLQTLEPRVFYVYIPDKNQSDIPVFDSNLMDLNFTTLFSENQFTGNDRINDANQLSFGITSRFIDAKTGKQRLSASIGQRYYYADQVVALPGQTSRDSNTSDILAGITANLKSDINMSAFWQYNTDDSTSVRTTITGRYNPEPGKSLNLSYSYRDNLIDQMDASGQWPLGRGWYGIGRINYSFKESRSIEALAGLEYDAGCWLVRSVMQRVSTATADANYALFFQLELGGLASIGANPLNVIRRNIPGYVRSNNIPDNVRQPYYE